MSAYRPNVPPPPPPPHSDLSIGALILGVIAFVAGIIPFAGFLGLVAILFAVIDSKAVDPPQSPKRHNLGKIGLVFGALATLGAVVWTIFIVWLSVSIKMGSCPHLYAFDGKGYQLDADLASGALYKGAERDDVDRLESVQEVDGKYLVRLQNDLEEVDHVDSLSLVVADAPEGFEVLPTASGELVAVPPRKGPLRTLSLDRTKESDVISLEFARPETKGALLVIRARNTAFAEEAFVKYMAQMGQGVRPLMELAGESKEGCACYKEYLDEEAHRMGLPLSISINGLPKELGPIGPAVPRFTVIPVELPEGQGPVKVKLTATPRFWEVSDVTLAPATTVKPEQEVLSPASARDQAGHDELSLLAKNDLARVSIQHGEHVDVSFVAPPLPAGKKRTVVAKLRGYYDLDIGGMKGVHLGFILAHRLGWVSLPEFAKTL